MAHSAIVYTLTVVKVAVRIMFVKRLLFGEILDGCKNGLKKTRKSQQKLTISLENICYFVSVRCIAVASAELLKPRICKEPTIRSMH